METTFITIHDLSPDARVLYASDSIVDILGYSPDEVVNRPCWDYFHHDEIPFARAKHGKGVEMDKAAVLSYCRLRDKDGHWLGCEVVFTIVFDVMVGCTSIYRRGLRSQSRAIEAPAIRRLFSTSPKDPRYHMLSHLSSKFELPPIHGNHEPRAALFLNRYTRTLTIMYATDGLADVLGITGEEMIGKSFYYCIEENCLQDAVRCLENAKANESIAYLRFWYRDPRQDTTQRWQAEDLPSHAEHEDQEMEDVASGEESATREDTMDEQNHYAHVSRDRETSHETSGSGVLSSHGSLEPMDRRRTGGYRAPLTHEDSRASSGRSSNPFSHEAVFGEPDHNLSSESSVSGSPIEMQSRSRGRWRNNRSSRSLELEAVVSCTSDGLVVCLRRARPAIPQDAKHLGPRAQVYANGLFAVPWATEPIIPPPHQRPQYTQPPDGAPPLPPGVTSMSPLSQHSRAGPDDFMSAIRDIGVFAWALVGINGCLAEYGHGKPRGEAQPASGLPIWQPEGHQEDPVGSGMNRVDGHSSYNSSSSGSIATAVVPSSRHQFSPRRDYDIGGPRGRSRDGTAGQNVHEAHMGYHEGMYEDHVQAAQMGRDGTHDDRAEGQMDGVYDDGTKIKSESPANNYSYHVETARLLQRRSTFASETSSSHRSPTELMSGPTSKEPWRGASVTNGRIDGDGFMLDGIGDHHGQKSNADSNNVRAASGDLYGFGDPGLSSKHVSKLYGRTYPAMLPSGTFDYTAHGGQTDGHP